jgi:hypothetical protein
VGTNIDDASMHRHAAMTSAHDSHPGAAELQRLAEAHHALGRVEPRTKSGTSSAQAAIQAAAEDARDAGCTWTQIGDVLGIARGNAYRRYRKAPSTRNTHVA